MRHLPLAILLQAGSILALAWSCPANAAEGPDEAASVDRPAIIVTARQREEDVQDMTSAISVVGGEWLDRFYTVNTQGLANLVPALSYSSANPRNTAFTIRSL